MDMSSEGHFRLYSQFDLEPFFSAPVATRIAFYQPHLKETNSCQIEAINTCTHNAYQSKAKKGRN